MTYQLSETDRAQLYTLRKHLLLHYNEADALIMEKLTSRALENGWMNKEDVYELIELLPRIIPAPKEELQGEQERPDADWNVSIDECGARYKREMERLYQLLSNWVFMQSAIYRKNMDPSQISIRKANSNNMKQEQ